MSTRETILSVRALVTGVRRELESAFGSVQVRGEIASATVSSLGHWYFTLKDESAQMRCVMFRAAARFLAFQPTEGMEVVATGRVTVYEARGDLQLGVETLKTVGAGAMAQAFEHLKRQLSAKGYFDQDRKRPIPEHARTIGVVTSLSAAALFDALRILLARQPGLRVIVSPATVQGAGAPAEIAHALGMLDRLGLCDVILVVRGGGSPEDLWAFNDPAVVEAVVNASVPVISGVGHETDVTLCDLAADLRAATPTHAAQSAVPDARVLVQQLARTEERMRQATMRRVREPQQFVDDSRRRLERALVHRLRVERGRHRAVGSRLDRLEPRRLLAARRDRVRQLTEILNRQVLRVASTERRRAEGHVERVVAAIGRFQRERRRILDLHVRRLDSLSPLAVLSRGYAIVTDPETGKALRRSGETRVGGAVDIRLGSGALAAQVRWIREDEP